MQIYSLMCPKYETGQQNSQVPGMKCRPADATGEWPRFQPRSAPKERFPCRAARFNKAFAPVTQAETSTRKEKKSG